MNAEEMLDNLIYHLDNDPHPPEVFEISQALSLLKLNLRKKDIYQDIRCQVQDLQNQKEKPKFDSSALLEITDNLQKCMLVFSTLNKEEALYREHIKKLKTTVAHLIFHLISSD